MGRRWPSREVGRATSYSASRRIRAQAAGRETTALEAVAKRCGGSGFGGVVVRGCGGRWGVGSFSMRGGGGWGVVGACGGVPALRACCRVVVWWGLGGGCCGAVVVELEHVPGEVDECPFAVDGVETSAAEAADSAVVLVIAEHRLDQAGAFG